MTLLYLKGVAFLGRWFAILPFGIALVAGYFWLGLVDNHFWWFLITGIFFVPFILATVALLLGIPFAGTRANAARGVLRDEAPALWEMAERAFGSDRASRMKLYVNSHVNASIGETRGLFGFFGKIYHLEIGLPLMAALDNEALQSVIEHEFAHVHFNDTMGARNVGEFFNCFEMVFDYLPPGETVSGTLIAYLLDDLAALTRREQMRLSRAAEVRADRYAVEKGSAQSSARAEQLIAIAGQFLYHEIVPEVEKEILGSSSLPLSPLERFLERRSELGTEQKRRDLWDAALAAEHDPDSSHPSVRERMAALEFGLDEMFEFPSSASLDALIPDDLLAKIRSESLSEWHAMHEHIFER